MRAKCGARCVRALTCSVRAGRVNPSCDRVSQTRRILELALVRPTGAAAAHAAWHDGARAQDGEIFSFDRGLPVAGSRVVQHTAERQELR